MDPLDTLEVTRRRSGHRWLDLIVGGSAIVIAVISLVVALRQSQIMERQLAASTWPFLLFTTSNLADDRSTAVIRLELKNAGVGPARIHQFSLRYAGAPVTSGDALLRLCCADLLERTPPHWSNSTARERVLTPGEVVPFFVLTGDAGNAPYHDRLNDLGTKLHLRACYCSVLDQCWMLDSSRSDPDPVAACPAATADDYRG